MKNIELKFDNFLKEKWKKESEEKCYINYNPYKFSTIWSNDSL